MPHSDGEGGYCCDGSKNIDTQEASTQCCLWQTSQGTADSACCEDGILNGGLSGEKEEWAKKLSKQCCENKGKKWG